MYHFRCKPGPSEINSKLDFPSRDKVPQNGRRAFLYANRKLAAVVPVMLLLAYLIMAGTIGFQEPSPGKGHAPIPAPRPDSILHDLSKLDVQRLLSGKNLLNLESSRIELQRGNSCFTVQTTIDPGLQQFMMQRLDHKNSRYIGIVIMDPKDGRILAMAGYDKDDPTINPCLDSRFPAASVFKIITAAAAVETCDLEPDSILKFDGGRYTLYKAQILSKNSKHANRITLRDSFAQSVNPVFGKLGANALGKDVIEEYAEAFGFNREIDFELPLRPSRIELSDKAYELAELASGFNRTTRISPLHGAMLAATIVNHGWVIEPTVVDWILDEAGQAVYQSRMKIRGQAIDPQTAGVMQELMQATVKSGTARKEFQKHTEAKLFSRLEIGGKTGSMGDGSAHRLYDWFVGYAKELHGTGGLVFSVVVAHENYIGTRAVAYAIMAVKEYFLSHFAGLHHGHPEAASKS